MANVLYHKLSNGNYMNISNPGGPIMFEVLPNPDDGHFYPAFTWDFTYYRRVGTGQTTAAAAQTQLDSFITSLNAGTIGP